MKQRFGIDTIILTSGVTAVICVILAVCGYYLYKRKCKKLACKKAKPDNSVSDYVNNELLKSTSKDGNKNEVFGSNTTDSSTSVEDSNNNNPHVSIDVPDSDQFGSRESECLLASNNDVEGPVETPTPVVADNGGGTENYGTGEDIHCRAASPGNISPQQYSSLSPGISALVPQSGAHVPTTDGRLQLTPTQGIV